MADIGIILLAAGASSRLGRPKQLLAYQGKTLLRYAAETAVAAGFSAVTVVTGAQHAALLPELAGLPVLPVHNPQWAVGMGTSIKTGLAALETLPHGANPTGIVVMLCDQPLVTPELLRQLAATHTATGRPMVAAEYNGVHGVPVYFGIDALPLLRALPDAGGAQQLLRQHPEWVAAVPFAGGAVDVDTEAQYAALLAQAPQ